MPAVKTHFLHQWNRRPYFNSLQKKATCHERSYRKFLRQQAITYLDSLWPRNTSILYRRGSNLLKKIDSGGYELKMFDENRRSFQVFYGADLYYFLKTEETSYLIQIFKKLLKENQRIYDKTLAIQKKVEID